MREIHVWADGSGTTRGNPGGWGYILIDVATDTERECQGAAVDATNNTMELTAVIRALQALKRPCEVTVHSDSEYVVNAFRLDWIAAWQRRKWVKVANVELWQELLVAVRPHRVRWVHVKGHSGVEHNERCDKLAGDARKALAKAMEEGTAGELEFEVQGDIGKQLELA